MSEQHSHLHTHGDVMHSHAHEHNADGGHDGPEHADAWYKSLTDLDDATIERIAERVIALLDRRASRQVRASITGLGDERTRLL